MTPNSAVDKFRLHEIEQQLASELHSAREQTRRAATEEQKHNVLETYLLALQLCWHCSATQSLQPRGACPRSSFGSQVAHTNRMARGLSNR
jgi:hypothetical protein